MFVKYTTGKANRKLEHVLLAPLSTHMWGRRGDTDVRPTKI